MGSEKVIQCNIRDISDRKEAEEALRKGEECYQNTLESLIEGCQIIGYDWRYLFINNSAVSQSKRKKEDFLGHTMMECYPDIEKTDLFAVLRRCMDERISQTIVHELKYPDNSKGWFESRIQPSPNGICILSSEITKCKQADEAMQKNEKHYRALIENSLENIILVSADGTITYEKPALPQPLGFLPNSLEGTNILDLFHPDDGDAAARLLELTVKHPGNGQKGVFRLRHQDGSWHRMESSMTNLLDETAVQSVVIYYRAVTRCQEDEQKIFNLAKFPSENPNPVLRLSSGWGCDLCQLSK